MAQITNLQHVFEEELRDIFSAEEQLVEALGKMAVNSASLTLKNTFEDHEQSK